MSTPDAPLPDRLRIALELLESFAADRTMLDQLPAQERKRLHQAVAHVYHPDPGVRRQTLKSRERERNAENIRRAEAVLDQTGIRTLRRRPVFTTPNYFPPQDLPSPGITNAPAESSELLHCYVCKQKYTLIHHFYDQLCPACGDFSRAYIRHLVNQEEILGLSIVPRPEAGHAEVEIPRHLERNIPKRLGNSLGALAERERFRRMTSYPEVVAQIDGQLPESPLIVETTAVFLPSEANFLILAMIVW
mgnify:CR=1 FL=1